MKNANKFLIVVESPTKVKTITKLLGDKQFQVLASVGHVRDLPVNKLGVDVNQEFKPEYVTISGRDKVLAQIKKAAAGCGRIYLAPDPDREGEAISWHIAQILPGREKDIYRLLLNEITKTGIREALKAPQRIDQDKFQAQQARRILDRLVGYHISPLLWKKVQRGLSAGRVQSVAVRLVCEREAEINAFVPREYWTITAKLEGDQPPIFNARLSKLGGKKANVDDETTAKALVDELHRLPFQVAKVTRKNTTRKPAPPFTTSKLQQEAARRLGFPAKKTMFVAQQLYEGIDIGEGEVGLITYMRTDSVRVSTEAQQETREYIAQELGSDYLPSKPPVYKSRKGAQEAHEAIRPSSVFRPPEALRSFLTKEQFSLYQLIWKRFVASQLPPAKLRVTSVDIAAGEGDATRGIFRISGTVILFPGFMKLYVEAKDEKEEEQEPAILPPLEVGQKLTLHELIPAQHFTQAPPRYSEATLVKELEEKGIGRPSTYAAILSTIQNRKYASKNKGRFHPTELGQMVTSLLVESFPEILNVDFTAKMEERLDDIEDGRKNCVNTLSQFWGPFSDSLKAAETSMRNLKQEVQETDIVCPDCGKKMLKRFGRFGHFLACSGYPECRYTQPLDDAPGGANQTGAEPAPEGGKCDLCGSPLLLKRGRYGEFWACSSYPKCKFTKPVSLDIPCPESGCSGFLSQRRSKKGRTFYSCTQYPKCKFLLWGKPIAEPCPQCGAKFLEEKSRAGKTYLCCNQSDCNYKKDG